MPTVDEWKYLKRRYQNLKANANAVLAELDNCKILISTANTNFSKAIVVDDDSFDGGKFDAMGDSVKDMAYKLRNTVIPALNSKISEINREIAKAEADAE